MGLSAPTDFYYLGLSQYYTDDFKSADTSFARLNIVSPSYITGYKWRAKNAVKMDNAEAPTGLAIPHLEKLIEVATKDVAKNKDNLIDAYGKTGEFYYNKGDYPKAIIAFEKLVEYDSANTNYADLLKAARESALSGAVPQK
jgi:tetratricopeptide (TPR) repeat protein